MDSVPASWTGDSVDTEGDSIRFTDLVKSTSVEIYFTNQKLKKLLDSASAMKKQLGEQPAKRLQQRLGEIEAVDCASELFELPGRWHPLTSNRSGQLSGDLKHPQRLILEPVDPSSVKKEDGGVNWDKVTEVVVVAIVDTHE